MSADRRLARLLTRVAEERVARGRPPQSHAPRTAKTFTSGVFQPPETAGGEAEIVATDFQNSNFQRNPRLITVRMLAMGTDGYPTQLIDSARSEVTYSTAGIDYAELHDGIASSSGLDDPRNDVEGVDLTLVDRLFRDY